MNNFRKENLGSLHVGPDSDYEKLSAGELFRQLTSEGGWKYGLLAEKLRTSEDAVKRWAANDVTPSAENVDEIIRAIKECAETDDVADEWIQALKRTWRRERLGKKKLDKLICQRVLESSDLTSLPALFESGVASLPIATAYVELQLVPISPGGANPTLLENSLTLRQKINRRIEARYTAKCSPKGLIDTDRFQSVLILGEPGSGKSSLLRRFVLDIAENKWDKFKVPLFVEARAYWSSKKAASTRYRTEDLLAYALSRLIPLKEVDEAKALMQCRKSASQYLLLVDGLDEIASDPDAVNSIYDELEGLTGCIPWIASSRPAGLMGGLGRAQHFQIVELDDDTIEVLIDNWCSSTKEALLTLDPRHLKAEIFGSSGTREMARNPFLLTALCFLKSIKPNENLPLSRVEVYGELIYQIGYQARKRLKSDDILAPHILEALQNFSFDLYDRPGGAIQIFSQNHWLKFSKKCEDVDAGDFKANILPSRMLSSWEGNDTQFHFLHLSLHEYLIAIAMLKRTVDDALERRFMPGWRAVFRFYGALLLQNGLDEDFKYLAKKLYKEKDINGFSLATLANIFSDAGIRDSREWIDEDLREELFIGIISGHDAGPVVMLEALATLDPEWLEEAVLTDLDDTVRSFEEHIAIEGEKYPGKGFVINGRGILSPYNQLAKARTGTANKIIRDAFWGDDQNLALLASYAYASTATPSEREVIINKANEISGSDPMALRVFAFAQAMYRAEFVPFLGKFLNFYSDTAEAPFSEIINLLADIRGDEAAEVLEALAVQEAKRFAVGEFNSFELVLRAISRLGGSAAITIFNKLLDMPEVSSWAQAIEIFCIEADPSDENAVMKALSEYSSLDEVISAITGAATFDRLPSHHVVQLIKERVDSDTLSGIEDLAFIERARLDAGQKPILCELLLEIAENVFERIHNAEDENDPDTLKTALTVIFYALEKGRWTPASALINRIFQNRKNNDDLIESAISLAGHIYADSSDDKALRNMKRFVFEKDNVHAEAALFAIGRISLEELFRLQSAETARHALEELAAEEDFMIFDDFWVDRFGKITYWDNPPKKILYVYDDIEPEAVHLFAHEMSRYGFCFEVGEPESCVAFLIFYDDEGYAADMAEQSRRIYRLTGENNPLRDVPRGLSDDEMLLFARELGEELLAKYAELRPASESLHL